MLELHRVDSSESSTELPNTSLDIGEFLSLKHPTNCWSFICTYCSKSFPSSQSLGGHQNAHRRERNEERRQYIKNPLAYRKRALLRSVKPPLNVMPPPRSGPKVYLPVVAMPTARTARPKPAYDPSKLTLRLDQGPSRVGAKAGYGFPYRAAHGNTNQHYYCHSCLNHVDWKPKLSLDLKLSPPWELTVKGCQTPNGAEEGNNSQRLDLTLKL